MRKTLRWLLVVVLLGAAAFGIYLWRQGPTYQPQPEPSVAPAEEAPPQAVVEPEMHYPLPEPEEEPPKEEPLPTLEKSDPTVLEALSDLFGKTAVKQFFLPQEIIRRIVVTIDNLPRQTVSAQLLPTKPPAGKFLVTGEGEKLIMAPENTERYRPYVRLAEKVDPEKLVAVYVRLYPLFQRAYQDLGYPKGYFNNRLVAVIDHMLKAPESEGPIALVQPHIFYKFADPELEARSAGHKLMLRIGNENASKIKAKLREIRAELTSGVVPSPAQVPAQ